MIKSVCGFCGVGCTLEVQNEKLNGKLCAKGINQIKAVNTDNRLLKPLVRNSINENFNTTTYDEAIKKISQKIKSTSKEKIGFYLSGQMLNEDYYIANKLGKGFLGTPNVDTNSRICMSSAVVAHKKSLGADFVPVRMDDINHANLLIIAGGNPAESHVILFNKIKKAKKAGLKVVVVDPRYTNSAKIADIYLPIKVGTDIDFFILISKRLVEEKLYDDNYVDNNLNGFKELKNSLINLDEDKLLENIEINKELFEKFFSLYKNSKNIITAWTMGLNQSSQGVDKNLALINTHLISGKIFKKGNGPFSLTGQSNAMGGREVGGLSTMLAVHLGFVEESVQKVSKFWKSDNVANKAGLTVTQMLEADLDILIICHTDPIYQLPNRAKMEKLIKNIDMVVEINAYENSQTSKYAHIRIPASPWGEKEGTQTSLDRTISRQNIITNSHINIKQDWEIFQHIAQNLGFKDAFNFKNSKEIFNEYKEMTKLNNHMDIYEANYDELNDNPFIWGENIDNYLSADKRGNLFFVQDEKLSEQNCKEYPFILLTGRTRDQWHTGTKTQKVPTLMKYKEINFCEINDLDAKELGIKDNDEIKVISRRGEFTTKAVLTPNINRGNLFIPISNTDINYLTLDLYDKQSLEPDFNHTAIKIIKI